MVLHWIPDSVHVVSNDPGCEGGRRVSKTMETRAYEVPVFAARHVSARPVRTSRQHSR